MPPLPNFLHIGASKSASSWLYYICKETEEIYVPETPDNVNFFTVHYHRGLDWYRETYFADVGEEKAVGEFSNSYMCYRPALERIARHIPDVKLTMTLRQPIEALYLAWAHIHLKDKPYGFDGRKGIGIPLQKCLHHHGHSWFRLYMDPRFYARHLEAIYEFFPREQVCVMFYDDLCDDPGGFLRRFYDFLEVKGNLETPLIDQDINPDAEDADVKSLDSEFLSELRDVFAPDIRHLEDLTGRDLSNWLE
ncbi:MAG: sulfotransferase [Planctomycetes bacterium]|nr:sulfotransferase [Planctomycetota bacterium]